MTALLADMKKPSAIGGWFFLLIMSATVTAVGQPRTKAVYKGFPSLIWPKLYDVTYLPADESFGGLDKPVFSEAARSLRGKVVSVPGYLVPFEGGATKSNHFMLSSLPINACFFCGGGGPETVIEVFTTKPISYTDQPVEIKGTLFLNDRDPGQMIYVLNSAEFLGTIDF